MFRALIWSSSGVCDYVVELPHWLYCSWIGVFWSQGAVRLGWYPGCRWVGIAYSMLSIRSLLRLKHLFIIVHQIRNYLKYVSSKDAKIFMNDLKKVYRASSKEIAENYLLELEEKWGEKYPLAGSPDATPAGPHPDSKTRQSKNNTANVVVQQHSRKLLKMDILMLETC